MPVEPQDMIDESDLPADLAALANQLQSEADDLAACFPAGEMHPVLKEVLTVQMRENERSQRSRSRVIAAMAPLFLLIGASALLLTMESGAARSNTDVIGKNEDTVATTPTKGQSKSEAVSIVEKSDDKKVDPSILANKLPSVSNEFGREWSEPELEGLIDIWDQDATVIRRVSF